jgi:hypothetical protein
MGTKSPNVLGPLMLATVAVWNDGIHIRDSACGLPLLALADYRSLTVSGLKPAWLLLRLRNLTLIPSETAPSVKARRTRMSFTYTPASSIR